MKFFDIDFGAFPEINVVASVEARSRRVLTTRELVGLALLGNHGISEAFSRSLPIIGPEKIVLTRGRFRVSQAEGHILRVSAERR